MASLPERTEPLKNKEEPRRSLGKSGSALKMGDEKDADLVKMPGLQSQDGMGEQRCEVPLE